MLKESDYAADRHGWGGGLLILIGLVSCEHWKYAECSWSDGA